MKYNRKFRFCAWFICLLMLFVFPFSAFAAESDKNASLAISYFHEDRAVSDVTFHIYRVADEAYQPVGAYAIYPVELKGLSSEELGAAASTLAAYTARDGIAATRSDITNPYGYLKFDDLQTGVYLVVGEIHIEGNTVYSPLPFLATLPSFDADGKALYDITAAPKDDMWQTEETLERSVKKVWSDKGYENARPAQITVQLLKDGEVADEVLLSNANNWSYSWSGLAPDSVWMVVEKEVPDDYTVTVKQQGTVFTITNTYVVTDVTPPTSNPSGVGGGTGSTPPPTLPQTGQLWWPVPILLFAGALMLLIGASLSRRSDTTDA